jgi:predicted nucleic acid-binding protein
LIVVDSSVLISLFREEITPAVKRFRDEIDPDEVLLGDVVLLEVLQGARDDLHARSLQTRLAKLQSVEMLNVNLSVTAAANYRRLRLLGAKVRKTPDLIIGTFCIDRGHALLHQHRDFDAMVEHLGLRLA